MADNAGREECSHWRVLQPLLWELQRLAAAVANGGHLWAQKCGHRSTATGAYAGADCGFDGTKPNELAYKMGQ